jgi:hypothetical protein
MSAGNLLIPFDFNPIETSTKISNYTIPVGRYARGIVRQGRQSLSIGNFAGTEARTINPSFVYLNGKNISFSDFSYLTSINSSATHTLNLASNLPYLGFFLDSTMVGLAGSAASIQILLGATWTTITTFANLLISVTLGGPIFYEYEDVNGIRSTGAQSSTNRFTISQGMRNGIIEGEPIWLKSGDVLGINNSLVWLEEYNVIQ